ncbi:MAG: DUF2911 domain-containing protein [Bacteroidota bacterium]
MRRKIILGILALIVLFIGYQVYKIRTTPPASPPDVVNFSEGDLEMSIDYSRPFKKGRLIFGEDSEVESEKPLQPYGQYWRMGANNATELSVNQNFTFAGNPVDAGTYRMYAIPGANEWEVILNSEAGVWLAFREPDYDKDILKVKVTPETIDPIVEQLTFDFSSDTTGIKMNMTWDNIKLSIPIAVQ